MARMTFRRGCAPLLLAAALAGCGPAGAAPPGPPSPAATPAASPTAAATGAGTSAAASAAPNRGGPAHILVVMDENTSYGSALGSCGAGAPDPYLCSLAATYASVAPWYGVEHPSQPNYIDIVSGADQGCHADYCAGARAYSAPDLGGQLSAAGIPWVAWMESMPSACYPGELHGSDATGLYALKHNPFVVFRDDMPPTPCHIQPYPGAAGMVRALDGPGAPAFAWITPNLCDDGHDNCGAGTLRQADTWLRANLAGVLTSSWFASGGTIIVTFDEGTSPNGATLGEQGGQVPMLVISARARGRGRVHLAGDHFGTLRTIEEAYGLPLLGAAAAARNGDLTALLG